jgi:hypothetical protein
MTPVPKAPERPSLAAATLLKNTTLAPAKVP